MSKNALPRSQIWLIAIRPKTLPAAAAPVIVGSVLAFSDQGFLFWPALACLVASLLLQIGSNLANDVFDYEKGTDQDERLGPTRVTQAGLLAPSEVKKGMLVVFGLSALLGIYLIITGGWPILVLGLAAILSAIVYTGGPFPLGYHGLGDLFVFIFFGLAAVAGTYYVQLLSVTATVWGMSVAMGLLTVAILVVNNLRDINNDRQTNKRTLAVRLGEKGTRLEYLFCLLGAYIIPIGLWGMRWLPALSLLILITVPFAIRLLREIYSETGRALNKTLAGTGRLELFYALAFAFGLVISTLLG